MIIKTTTIDGKEVKVKLTSSQIMDIVAEYQKPKGLWRPKEKERFYYVDAYGDYYFDYNDGYAEFVEPVFGTEDEAARYAEYLKAKHACEQFIAEYNDGWEPDWLNGNQQKYFVVLQPQSNYIYYDCVRNTKFLSTSLYFKDNKFNLDASEVRDAFIAMLSY